MLTKHGIIYFISFIISYYLAYINYYQFINLIILGWSIFGLTSIGHEIYHLKKQNLLLNIIGFCCLDLFSINKHNWVERHNKWHHYNVYEIGEDEHMIEGSHIKNFFNTIIVLSKTYNLFEFSFKNIILIIIRIIIFTNISLSALPIVYTTIIICVTYLTFIAHCAPVINDIDTHELNQLHRSVDIFPNNSMITLFTGAFHMHTAHHLSPSTTRDNLYDVHYKYMDKYPLDYRTINTWKELCNLLKYGHMQFKTMDEWNAKIK